MSHVVASEIAFTDLDLLKKVIASLFPKLQWLDKKTYEWVGRWYKDYHKEDAAYKRGIDPKDYGKCHAALHMDGVEFEIGVCKRSDGNGYSVVWDFVGDGHRLSAYIGDNAEKLACAYSRLYVEQYGIEHGYCTCTTEDQDYITVELNQV